MEANAQGSAVAGGSVLELKKMRHRNDLLGDVLIRFEDVFWSGTNGDPTDGVRVLHEVFTRHLAEAEDLISLVRVRVAIEEMNATRLGDLGRLSGMPGAASSADNSSFFGGTAALGLGWKGTGGTTGFIATGNGITSIGSTPVSNNLLGSITAMAKSMATTVMNSSSSQSRQEKPMSSPRGTNSALSVAAMNLSAEDALGPGSPAGNGPTTSSDGSALASDAVNFSSTGAHGVTEDASSLTPAIRTLREQMMATAAVHRRHADTLTLNVLSPLTAFVDQHRRTLNHKRAEVDAAHTQLQRIASEIEARRHQYFSKSRLADDEDEKFKVDGEFRANPQKLNPILFGSRSLPLQEFHDIVNTLKRELKTKAILTPLGIFENCFLGEDALGILQIKYPKVSRPDIRDLCQEFVTRRSISPVIGGSDGKFSAALPYMFGRPLLKSGEAPHVKARQDAEIAKLEYEASIGSSENARAALEALIGEYLVAAQEAETYRLTIAREAIMALEEAQMNVINEIGSSWSPRGAGLLNSTGCNERGEEDFLLHTPNVGEGVLHIATRYRTGHLRSPPFMFDSYEDGQVANQTFGVSIEELSYLHKTVIPLVVLLSVNHLVPGLGTGQAAVDAWLMPNPDPPAVQFLRTELNKVDEMALRAVSFKRYSPVVIATVLRMFLVEVPVSVCAYDVYDALKALYAEGGERDDTERFKKVRVLIDSLPPQHAETLAFITSYFSSIVKPLEESDKRIPRLCWSLAPMILRPKQETREILADEHPWLFVRDLVLHHFEIFGEYDLQGAITNEEKFVARPLKKERGKKPKAVKKVPVVEARASEAAPEVVQVEASVASVEALPPPAPYRAPIDAVGGDKDPSWTVWEKDEKDERPES
ncbi:hypothetical protein HK101_001939 [Irineochytrium annulatum]|nr:hypothetical protein HK101_001939 [Irineochytrium annulatum]